VTFLRMPMGFRPPAPTPALVQAELQQPPQGQGDHLRLDGAQHRLVGPSPAFFHARVLFMVAEAGSKRLHDLRGREIQGRGHQEPGLAVSWHRDDEDVYRDLWPTDCAPAPQLFVPEWAYPAVHPRPAGPPGGGPVRVVFRGGEPLAPLRPTALPPGSGHYRVGQPCEDLNPSLLRTRCQRLLKKGPFRWALPPF
jgi:hypothetical protein